MIDLKCSSCKYWDRKEEMPEMGLCRRHAPRAAVASPDGSKVLVETLWPVTKEDTWCGEWDNKVEIGEETGPGASDKVKVGPL